MYDRFGLFGENPFFLSEEGNLSRHNVKETAYFGNRTTEKSQNSAALFGNSL